jgi:hypothetical protein
VLSGDSSDNVGQSTFSVAAVADWVPMRRASPHSLHLALSDRPLESRFDVENPTCNNGRSGDRGEVGRHGTGRHDQTGVATS